MDIAPPTPRAPRRLLADAVDRALEVAIAPSFTRVGCAIRSRLDHWTSIDADDLTDRVVVVTGATSGLGHAAARTLSAAGATLEIIARNPTRAAAICEELRPTAKAHVDFVVADTGDLDAIRRAADELTRRHGAIHALIHNAGALDRQYARSPQGFEQTVASQVLGPFLLTELLLPSLRACSGSRVLWVSSGGMYSQPLSVADLELPRERYDGTVAYARAKRAQVTIAQLWADRLRPDRVAVHSMHPGWADTPGVRRSLPTFRALTGPLLRSADEGADTLVWLTAADIPLEQSGSFWLDRRPRAIHRLSSTRRSDTADERRRLWEWCVERTGVSDSRFEPRH